MYWFLISVGDGNVFPQPKGLSKVFPKWLDYVFHTNIIIFAIIEAFICQHKYSKRLTNLKIMLGFLITYLGWFHIVYYKTGHWVYGIIGKCENQMQRNILFLSVGVLAIIVYILGEIINKFACKNRKTEIKDD